MRPIDLMLLSISEKQTNYTKSPTSPWGQMSDLWLNPWPPKKPIRKPLLTLLIFISPFLFLLSCHRCIAPFLSRLRGFMLRALGWKYISLDRCRCTSSWTGALRGLWTCSQHIQQNVCVSWYQWKQLRLPHLQHHSKDHNLNSATSSSCHLDLRTLVQFWLIPPAQALVGLYGACHGMWLHFLAGNPTTCTVSLQTRCIGTWVTCFQFYIRV